MVKERIKNKSNYLDLVVKTEEEYINIEVSNNSYNEVIAYRNFAYLINLANNVILEGIKAKEHPSVKQINLIFGRKNDNYQISRYDLYSSEENKKFNENLEIININVDKLKEMYYNSNRKLTKIIPIIALSMTKEELEENKEESNVFENVLCNLDKINDTNIVPMFMPIEEEKKWEKEMMIELWKREGVKQGIEQGVEENRLDIVYKMLKENLDMKLISKITGLPVKKIKAIAKTQNY